MILKLFTGPVIDPRLLFLRLRYLYICPKACCSLVFERIRLADCFRD